MKILAIGDFHRKFPNKLKKEVKKADLVLCTGDLGGSKKLLKLVFKYLREKWWKNIGMKRAKKLVMEDYNKGKKIIDELNSLNKKIYIISGNWDFTSHSRAERDIGLNLESYHEIIKKKKNLFFANRKFMKINCLNILFFGGMVTAGDYLTGKVFNKEKTKKMIKDSKRETKHIMKFVNKKVDILFTHYPPYGFFDVVKYKGHNPMKGKHAGFIGYTEFIKKNKPEMVLSGHMHEYQGIKKLGKTKIISIGSASRGKGAIIDFDENKKKIKSVKFIK
jgi:Icc-related predicted phosphoesterase